MSSNYVWLIACLDRDDTRSFVQSWDGGTLILTFFANQSKMFRAESKASRAKGLLSARMKDDPWVRFEVVRAGVKRKGAAAPRT